MDAKTLSIFFLILTPIVIQAWQTVDRRATRELRRDSHFLAKRHMLPRDSEKKRRTSTQKAKVMRKKPSGHLKPLQDDDMENDEVVSVAIGPPAMRPKYDKHRHGAKTNRTTVSNTTASNLVKDVLVQLGREFLTHNVNEDFVFGQYVGNAMKNLSSAIKLRMQHDVLDLILKYQKINRGDEIKVMPSAPVLVQEEKNTLSLLKDIKNEKKAANETEEGWPDFSNLEKYVG